MLPAPLPEPLRSRPFSVAEAQALGVGPERLRRRDLFAPAHGVRAPLPPAPPPGETPWDAFARRHRESARYESARLAEDAVLSHITAAVLHRFPLSVPRIRDAAIHVTVRTPDARRRHRGVVMHPLPKDLTDVRTVEGLRVTSPVDTWCALSALLTIDELVRLGDHLVRREDPDATMARLHAAVRRYRGRHGVKRLRAAVDLVRPGTDSPRETDLRLRLVRGGLPEPQVNVPVRDGEGRHIKLGDLVFERYRVLTEYDGQQHRTDDIQYARDIWQLERATTAGWLVVRIRKGEEHTAVRRTLAALRAHGYPGPPSLPGHV